MKLSRYYDNDNQGSGGEGSYKEGQGEAAANVSQGEAGGDRNG